MNGRRRNVVLIILSILIFLIIWVSLIVSVSFISLLVSKYSKNRVLGDEELQTDEIYQILKYDPITDEKYQGIITIPSSVNDVGFGHQQYDEEDGTYTLISKMGEEEYICEGVCVCVNENNRRTATSITVKRGLVFLLTAVTSALAFKTARKEFDEICKSEKGICEDDGDIIFSEVENCGTGLNVQRHERSGFKKKNKKKIPIQLPKDEKWNDPDDDLYVIDDDEYVPDLEKLTDPTRGDGEIGDREGLERFLCFGYCLFDKKKWYEFVVEEVKWEIGERICREKTVNKEVFAFRTGENLPGVILSPKQVEMQAIALFIEIMDSLCPLAAVEIDSPKYAVNPKIYKTEKICLGHDRVDKKSGRKINHSVECRAVGESFY